MVILLVLASILLLVAVPLVIDNRDLLLERLHGRERERDPQAEPPLPFLIIPTTHDESAGALAATSRGDEHLPWQPRGDSAARWADPAQITTYTPAGISTSDEVTDEVPEEALLGAQTVVFRYPSDEPVQILPGRLEIVAGEPPRDDLRFFGHIGEPVQVTLGREGGPPQSAITLHSPTVSRRHARMEFSNGRWQITNLSKTNPVLVNDRMLSPDSNVPCLLAEGDRIELGEVVLRFHER